MKQDKYTILGLIGLIIILSIILGVRVAARHANLSLQIAEAEMSSSGSSINQNMDFSKYAGENLTYEDIQKMLTEIEVYVIGVTKIPLEDRTVVNLNLTTNKTAGTLSDYSKSLNDIKQNDVVDGRTYKVEIKSGLTETTKIMEIVII